MTTKRRNVNMHACTYVCMYIHVYVCMHVCMYVSVYVGSLVEACGGIVGEVSCRIAQASRVLAVSMILCSLHQT